MAIYEILKRCQRCEGGGKIPNVLDGGSFEAEDCVRCSGTGKYFFGTIDLSDLEDKIDDTLSKCNDIFEKVNE